MAGYGGLGLYLALGAGLVASFIFLTRASGPRRGPLETQRPVECRERRVLSPDQRLAAGFYRVAVPFIVFDVAAAFLYPWAVVWGELGWFGYLTMLLFLVVIGVGLTYEWLKGGLDWS